MQVARWEKHEEEKEEAEAAAAEARDLARAIKGLNDNANGTDRFGFQVCSLRPPAPSSRSPLLPHSRRIQISSTSTSLQP